MEDKKQNFDYSTLYRGFQRAAGGAAPAQKAAPERQEEPSAAHHVRDPQLEQTLQREMEEQLKILGQSVTEGIRYGFEGRGQQLGDQAAKFGGAVWDVVTYSLGQASDELKRAADSLKAEASTAAPNAVKSAEYSWNVVSKPAARASSLQKSFRKRLGIGLAQVIPGGILAFGLILAGIICLIAAPAAGPAYNVDVVNVIGCSMFISGLPFAWLTWLGGRNIGASRRIRAYAEAIGGRTSISVRALAEAVQKPVKKVRKDLRKMLGKGWMTGWLDSAEDMFYLNAEEWRAAMDRREAEILSGVSAQKSAEQPPQSEENKTQPAVEPETIQRFVQVLGTEKKLMQDEIAVAELEKMQATSRAICEWVTAHPESAPKARRFVTYYIPTTLKLLHTYNEVKDQQGENVEAIRRDIGGILYTLNTAFANLYNALLSDMAMDVSSEIAALQGMLAQDGLSQAQNGPFA